MIFNTDSTITNLSLSSQNRLFSCSGIGLLVRFLVFHSIKISFLKPEACAIIFRTAVFKFMKKRNKKIKNVVYVAAHATPLWVFFSPRVYIFRLWLITQCYLATFLHILFITTMSFVNFAAAAAFYPHCIAFARRHRETSENLCRYSQSFPLKHDLRN